MARRPLYYCCTLLKQSKLMFTMFSTIFSQDSLLTAEWEALKRTLQVRIISILPYKLFARPGCDPLNLQALEMLK